MNKFFKKWQLLAFSVLALTSCNKDKDENIFSDGNILMTTRISNPDGNSGSGYLQFIKNLEPKKYSNKKGFPISYSTSPIIKDNIIYILPGWDNTNYLKSYTNNNGKLTLKNEVELPAKSGAHTLTIINDKIYVPYSLMGKIAVLNKSTLVIEKEIDLSEYGVGDKNPDPCQMIERDGILFVALNQIKGNEHTPEATRNKVDILLIDVKSNQVIKKIIDETSNMSMPTKPRSGGEFTMFLDEYEDVYINCISGFGYLGHDAGFLRIKKGETDFDKSYQFKITQTEIEGESNKASYLISTRYTKDGIVYATADIPAYYSAQPDWFKDRTVIPLKIDLKMKTIKRIGKQRSNNFGVSVGLFKDKVIFGLSTESDNGFFIYDTESEKISDKAIIETTGYPGNIFDLN